MRSKYMIYYVFLLSSIGLIKAQDYSAYKKAQFVQQSDTLQYRILWPKNFSEDQQYPVVLFLHGAGERGNDNKTQLVHGAKLFLDPENRKKYPAIVIFPQCPKDEYWSNALIDRSKKGRDKFNYRQQGPPVTSLRLVIALMDRMVAEPFTKDDQIYVGGLSMGGMGTFELLSRKPDTFAAAFPICGGGNPQMADSYARNTALWVFHGAKDDVVDPSFSKEMVIAVKKAGGKPKFTLYKDANHNSWDPAFAEPELLSWLFSHKKTKP